MKVLVVSHNCFSSSQSMGKTLASLFCSFQKKELMQLYLYPSLPNISICESLYRITDSDVISSVVKRNSCGRVISQNEIDSSNLLYESDAVAAKYKGMKRDSFLIHRTRDLIWQLGNWKTNELKQWLSEGKPDIVFYALGDAIFSQEIALWVADYMQIPLIAYVCDEFFFSLQNSRDRIKKLFRHQLVNNIEKTLRKSSHIITICEELGCIYEKQFVVPHTTIMTGSSFPAGNMKSTNNSKRISYIGNLDFNRWKPILKISKALETINNEENTQFELTYYGNECKHLKGKVRYGGQLTGMQVQQVISDSTLLIHTETFDDEYRERLRYSISTKIADSLASGVNLFAFGPSDISSIQHLSRNKCAFVASDENVLCTTLWSSLFDVNARNQFQTQALFIAKKMHNRDKNSALLYSVLSELISSK